MKTFSKMLDKNTYILLSWYLQPVIKKKKKKTRTPRYLYFPYNSSSSPESLQTILCMSSSE